MMTTASLVLSLLFFTQPQEAKGSTARGIDLDQARSLFNLAKELCLQDAGRLWGQPLSGPWLFVDPATRQVVASQADAEGQLREAQGVFLGQLPASIPAANTSVKWLGTTWVMVLWPLPEKPIVRRSLLMHETWHRLQADLGFPATNPKNAHLETLEGRYWLQMEWRALAAALSAKDEARRQAAADALLFRAVRREFASHARIEERQLEMHEGLAEYTGIHLSGCGQDEQQSFVVQELRERPARLDSFSRSFAYLSGPAYGLLLEETAHPWRTGLKPDHDLGERLRVFMNLPEIHPDLNQAKSRAEMYEGSKLYQAERERDERRQKELAKYEQQFIKGSVLILPLKKMQIQLNPNRVFSLGEEGTLYLDARLSDEWGVLSAKGGVFIAKDFKRAMVPLPKELQPRPLRGEGWELQLEPGWEPQAAERNGDWRIGRTAK